MMGGKFKMSKITGSAIMAKYMPGEVENSFYKTQEMCSSTGRTHRTGIAKSKFLYYVESGSKELKVRKTILMG